MTYDNGQPVNIGDIVHIKRQPYTVARFAGDYVMLQSMNERKTFKPVYPQQIGARVTL
jgi:hypothetical protein